MVKTIVSVLISALLLISSAVFEKLFVADQFKEFGACVSQLQTKIECGQATKDDAALVKSVWDNKKSLLHIVIPHNDIGWIDHWLNETEGYIQTENFNDAYAKLNIIATLCEQIPSQYQFSFGTIF